MLFLASGQRICAMQLIGRGSALSAAYNSRQNQGETFTNYLPGGEHTCSGSAQGFEQKKYLKAHVIDLVYSALNINQTPCNCLGQTHINVCYC